MLDAHRSAVSGVLDYLESHLVTVARAGAPLGRVPPDGVVLARFDHLRNAASEPHLHTHVLMANLGRGPEGRWSSIGNGDWKMWRRGMFALYSLGLRHELSQAGWQLDWRIRPDGLADVADVPRAAIRATSTQQAASRSLGRFEARAAARPQPWREHLMRLGFDQVAVSASVAGAPPDVERPDPGTARNVTSRLAMQRSSFRRADVLVALAECHPGGLPAGEAHLWAERFCGSAVPIPTTRPHPRWTTEMAQLSDAKLMELRSEGRVEVLGSSPGQSSLLSHSHHIAERLEEWQRIGWTVAVDCRRERDPARWRTLTGLPDAAEVPRPDVLLVDQADRRPTPELLALLNTRTPGGLTVMIEGGTMPRLTEPASLGFVALGERMGRSMPVPHAAHPAIEDLVGRWAALPDSAAASLLVGLGPEEAEALNLAARHNALTGGRIDRHGPSVAVAKREFQAGDRVMVGGEGTERPRGTLGTVESIGLRAITVRWDDRHLDELAGSAQRSLTYGYAVTPDVAARTTDKPLYLLGPVEAVPRLAHRVREATAAPTMEGPELARRRDAGLGLGR